MKRIFAVLLAACAAGCVSKQEAHNGAVRFLNAVPDAPLMNMYIDGELRTAGIDYARGSAYTAIAAATYPMRIDELLPEDAVPNALPVFAQILPLAVNDQVTLVVVGDAATHSEETLQIVTRARGVPTGKTRVQLVNATAGIAPVDIYVTAPDAVITASTPLAPGLAYKAYTAQQDITGGNVKVVVTPAGDPATVLLDSGPLFFPLEGNLLLSVVQNTGLDAATRPVMLVFMTGTGSSVIIDKNTKANVRVVNASPGAYSLDAFVNKTTVDNATRQTCDAGTPETDTLLEICATPYEYVGAYNAIDPGTYDFKMQKTNDAAVLAKSFGGNFVIGGQSTLVMSGLLSPTALTTDLLLQTLLGARRVATMAQLRLVDLSVAATAAIEGDPTTDRLEVYITAPGADLIPLDPNFAGFRFGSDTGYFAELPGTYQISFVKSDTATPTVAPVVLLTQLVSLDASGLYTLLITDTVGGVAPIKFLSIEDDPAP